MYLVIVNQQPPWFPFYSSLQQFRSAVTLLLIVKITAVVLQSWHDFLICLDSFFAPLTVTEFQKV